MRLAVATLLTSALVAGCTQSDINRAQTGFDGAVITVVQPTDITAPNGYVLPQENTGNVITVARIQFADMQQVASVSASNLCWDGSEGAWLGRLHFCPASPARRTIRMNYTEDGSATRTASVSNTVVVDTTGADTAGGDTVGDDTVGGDTTTTANSTSAPVADDTSVADNGTFTAKYDRIEKVYGHRSYADLPETQQDAVRDYYKDNGADGDWSDFKPAS